MKEQTGILIFPEINLLAELELRRGEVSKTEYIERLLKQSFKQDGVLYINEDGQITSCRRCQYYNCGCRQECERYEVEL